MKKKVIILCTIIVIILGIVGAYVILNPKQVLFLKDNIETKTIEYGQKVSTSLEEYLSFEKIDEKTKDRILEEAVIETPDNEEGKDYVAVGEYNVKISYLKDSVSLSLVVKDSTLPVIKGQEILSYDVGTNLDKIDFTKLYTVEDLSETKLTWDYSNVDSKKVGKYKMKVEAVDAYDNKSTKEVEVEITEKSDATLEPESPSSTQVESVHQNQGARKVICIDPGHQAKGSKAKEAVGPGSSVMKIQDGGGATGYATKITEATLNLNVALNLKAELEARGYTVIMTRTTNNTNIGNIERAQIANKAGANAFIRIHADSVDNHSVTGATALCISSKNPYHKELFSQSNKLAKAIINAYCSATGTKNRGVSYHDDMTGLNWAGVPSMLIELGFLSNANEDKLMNSATYQNRMVKGISNGIDNFFK